jgi:hypothetical protein
MRELPAHADNNDWYGFVAGRQSTPVLRQNGRSWALQGVEARYEDVRAFMLKLLGARVISVDCGGS